jgi:hypothetical protein
LRASFSQILRLQFYTLLIVSMPTGPLMQVALIFILELKQMLSLFGKYCGETHLKYFLLFCQRLIQNLSLLGIVSLLGYNMVKEWRTGSKFVTAEIQIYLFYFLAGLIAFEGFLVCLKFVGSVIGILTCSCIVKGKSKESYVEFQKTREDYEVEIMEIEDKIDFSEFINDEDIREIEEMA